ncbi:type III-B CRISPR module RAMP protein Cmr1 [Psychrobacter immobilis]|uniref:type III-B CRISPR module RAMP protein Cmr1 n=1 Tax=Psychrobacter immobilis TaxID=498 RepID=UPI00191870E7|nr:type III-B CRISPR module RAMP protein Cmr1 [Psychrobacter immobilis]
MSLRVPNESIEVPSLTAVEPVLEWHTLSCELVTPMYGGGVQSHTVDKNMPIRVSGIRGQLRFWWRLLAKHQWKLGDDEAIQKQEFALWGGMGDDGQASKVFLRVNNFKKLQIEAWAKYEPHHAGGYKSIPTAEKWAEAPYALFPAQGKKPGLPDSEAPHELAKPGLTWELQFKFDARATDEQQQQVIDTLRWWANFGGVGARTRRGLGSIQVTSANNFDSIMQPLNIDEITSAGCQLVTGQPYKSDATAAWTNSVNKMQQFRQAVGIGRNPGNPRPGRSRWPEPDAIRRLTGANHSNHRPEHPAGNIFPRAMFGLPIIFHFVGSGEPQDTTLNLNNAERMSSPVILRAYFDGKEWFSSALLTPYKRPADMTLKNINNQTTEVWALGADQLIRPMEDNEGGNPLAAFMTFFAKKS